LDRELVFGGHVIIKLGGFFGGFGGDFGLDFGLGGGLGFSFGLGISLRIGGVSLGVLLRLGFFFIWKFPFKNYQIYTTVTSRYIKIGQ